MARHKLTKEESSKGGQKSKKEDPVKKRLDSLINELVSEDKLNAQDIWNDIQAITDPARRFDRKIALLEFKLPKPKQIELTSDTEPGVYIIGGLPASKYESSG